MHVVFDLCSSPTLSLYNKGCIFSRRRKSCSTQESITRQACCCLPFPIPFQSCIRNRLFSCFFYFSPHFSLARVTFSGSPYRRHGLRNNAFLQFQRGKNYIVRKDIRNEFRFSTDRHRDMLISRPTPKPKTKNPKP
jgi:hypothetical protein